MMCCCQDNELQASRTRGAAGLSEEEVDALRSEVQRLRLEVASAATAAAAAGDAEHAAKAAAAAAQQQATAQLSSLTSSAKFAQEVRDRGVGPAPLFMFFRGFPTNQPRAQQHSLQSPSEHRSPNL
jgi:hypothetical protein